MGMGKRVESCLKCSPWLQLFWWKYIAEIRAWVCEFQVSVIFLSHSMQLSHGISHWNWYVCKDFWATRWSYGLPLVCWLMSAVVKDWGLLCIWFCLCHVRPSSVLSETENTTLQTCTLIPACSCVWQLPDPIVFHTCVNHATHKACEMECLHHTNCNNRLSTDFCKMLVDNFLQCPETYYKESLSVFQRERKMR